MRLPGLVVAALAACRIAPAGGPPPSRDPRAELVAIAGGDFEMGDAFGVAHGRRDETPHPMTIASFRLMRYEVTNAQFAGFVAETGYRTAPERRGFGMLWNGRWRRAAGAEWRHPFGPGSGLAGRSDHPVVQISARDAAAFCAHYGLRLPREEEWEYAARGPRYRRYPWGNQPPEDAGGRRANFGRVACCAADDADGYLTTAPVGRFPRGVSPFGLWDMAGNVWEWTASEFPGRPGTVALRGGGWGNDPFCLRVSYRHDNEPDIGRDHVGFRCAADR